MLIMVKRKKGRDKSEEPTIFIPDRPPPSYMLGGRKSMHSTPYFIKSNQQRGFYGAFGFLTSTKSSAMAKSHSEITQIAQIALAGRTITVGNSNFNN